MTKDQAQAELDRLRESTGGFYASPAGLSLLKWLDDFEARMVADAIKESDPIKRGSLLDQAKGLRVFRETYLATLINRD